MCMAENARRACMTYRLVVPIWRMLRTLDLARCLRHSPGTFTYIGIWRVQMVKLLASMASSSLQMEATWWISLSSSSV